MTDASRRPKQPEHPQPPGSAGGQDDLEPRRRVAQLLGDVLPDVTTDETAAGWGESEPASRDEDLLRDVPPHYGS